MTATLTKEVTPLAPGVFQISDFRLDNYYLVVGGERAALIDCGCGLGNTWEEIREITDLPVVVILTHGHVDHVGTAHQFDDVWMHPADDEVARGMFGRPDLIQWYVETRTPLRHPGAGHVEALSALVPDAPVPMFDYQPLVDGQRFDLGGRVLEVIHTPGHTPGSVCVLDATAGLLFTGDCLNASSIIPNKEGGTRDEIAEFRASVARMAERASEFRGTCPGHDGTVIDKQLISDHLALCDGLLDGSLAGDYEEVGIRKGRVVRVGMAELWYEADA